MSKRAAAFSDGAGRPPALGTRHAVLRSLLFLFLGFVVIWDLATSEPSEAAIVRASAHAWRWTQEQIERHDLIERARAALTETAQAVRHSLAESAGAGSPVPAVAAPPPVEPIFAEALAGVGLRAAAPTPPADARAEELRIGDSVFARAAILTFIAEASARTGVSAAYLEALALRESSFNPVAASDRSSARGLYQFIDSTWLEVFAQHGAEHEQGELAALIAITADGQPEIADRSARRRILDLRYDPKLSTFLAAQLARDNGAALEDSLGRPVDDAELYIAHFLGRAGARTLIETRAARPNASAADLFPWAARANRRHFYDGRRERSVAELYDALLLDAGELVGGATVAALDAAGG